VYQLASPNYYEPVEDWGMEENTNIDVIKKIGDNYI
jgi:hypothetical protein